VQLRRQRNVNDEWWLLITDNKLKKHPPSPSRSFPIDHTVWRYSLVTCATDSLHELTASYSCNLYNSNHNQSSLFWFQIELSLSAMFRHRASETHRRCLRLFQSLTLNDDERPASRSGLFTPCINWMGLRASLDEVEKLKFFTLPGLDLRPLGRPSCSQSLYRLLWSKFKQMYDAIGSLFYSLLHAAGIARYSEWLRTVRPGIDSWQR
jgi:hypothetical protein